MIMHCNIIGLYILDKIDLLEQVMNVSFSYFEGLEVNLSMIKCF